MTRLAENRDTHLSPAEVAAETLRQFDQQMTEPSIRSLASALRVAPSAIYHHFASVAAIYQGAVELVWREASSNFLELEPNPLEADPEDVLVAVGIATRRAWLGHYRLAPYMAATPEATETISNSLGLMAILFERLGLQGDRAAAAFHTYASFMIGEVLFAADRLRANEQLEAQRSRGDRAGEFHAAPAAEYTERTHESTRRAIDEVMGLSITDPARDEQLVAEGIRRLVKSLR